MDNKYIMMELIYSSSFKLYKKPQILMCILFLFISFSIVRCYVMGVNIFRNYFKLDFYQKKKKEFA